MEIQSENNRVHKTNALAVVSFGLGILVLFQLAPLALGVFAPDLLSTLDSKLSYEAKNVFDYYIVFGSIPFSIASLITGILALKRLRRNPTEEGKFLAIFAIIIGIFGLYFILSLLI